MLFRAHVLSPRLALYFLLEGADQLPLYQTCLYCISLYPDIDPRFDICISSVDPETPCLLLVSLLHGRVKQLTMSGGVGVWLVGVLGGGG